MRQFRSVPLPEAAMPFQPTPTLAARLLPRRSRPGSAVVPTPKHLARELAAARKAYAVKAGIFEKGLATTREPELAATRRAAHALLLEPSLEALAAAESVEVVAAASVMLSQADGRAELLPAVAAARGLADAVAVTARASGFELEAEGGYLNAVFVVAHKQRHWRTWGDPGVVLRSLVCAAKDDDYAAARTCAEGWRQKLAPYPRALLDYAFPDEPWAAEDLRAFVTDPETSRHLDWFGLLLGACTDPEAIAACAGLPHAAHTLSTWALEVASVLPEEAALPLFERALESLLTKPKYGPLLKTPPRAIAEAMGCYRSAGASALLARYFGHAVLGPVVAAYFQDAPEQREALATVAAGKSKAAASATRLLTRKADGAGPVLAPESLPPVLRDRPWRPRKGAPPRPTVRDLVPPEAPESLDLTDADRADVFETTSSFPVRDPTPAELAKWRADVEAERYTQADFVHGKSSGGGWEYLRVPVAERAWAFDRGAYLTSTPLQFLVQVGLPAVPRLLSIWVKQLGWEEGDRYLAAVSKIRSARVAPSMAQVAQRKRYRRPALAWLERNVELAALGLVPLAVGPGPERGAAEDALLALARRGHDGVVRAQARRYGDEAAAAIEQLLARDPLALDVARPKPPPFLRPAELPPVCDAAGARLDEDGVEALLELLQVAALVDPPYPGLRLVREAFTAESLGAFARELQEQWVLAGAPRRHEWMSFASVHLPSEDSSRRLAALAREWARRDAAKASSACAALAALGTDAALMHLAQVAETSRFEKLRGEATELIREAAAARGLTPEELGDRTVPDLGLGPDGTLELDLGPRRIRATLDEVLGPVLLDAEGKRLASFPRANQQDDAAKAKEAKARYQQLKDDAAAVAQRQLRRLESAMVAQRTWSSAEFVERLVRHPLLGHLARRLVFEAGDGEEWKTFRVAEDRTFADVTDLEFQLPGARVRVAHPALLAEADRTAWGTLFADYQLLQPFPQLGRPVFAPTREEAGATSLGRVEGARSDARRLLGTLESRGWRRIGGGHVSAYAKTCRGAGGTFEAQLAITPGISLEDVAGAPEQTCGALTLTGAGGKPATWGALGAVDFSEVVRDVESLR